MALLFDPDALDGIARSDAQRVRSKIEWLWENRAVANHLPLSANLAGFYKRRVGIYRIIYTWEPDPDDMVIYKVGTRDDIYDTNL